MTVQTSINKAIEANHDQRQDDEISRQNWIRDKGIECFVRKIVGIIQRITALTGCGKARKKHKRCGVKQKNRFVGIGRPSQP